MDKSNSFNVGSEVELVQLKKETVAKLNSMCKGEDTIDSVIMGLIAFDSSIRSRMGNIRSVELPTETPNKKIKFKIGER